MTPHSEERRHFRPGKGKEIFCKKADTIWLKELLGGSALQGYLGQIGSLCFSAKSFLWDEPTSASLSPNSALENVWMLTFLPPLIPLNTISIPKTLPLVKFPLRMCDPVQEKHPLPFPRHSTFDNVGDGASNELLLWGIQ